MLVTAKIQDMKNAINSLKLPDGLKSSMNTKLDNALNLFENNKHNAIFNMNAIMLPKICLCQ